MTILAAAAIAPQYSDDTELVRSTVDYVDAPVPSDDKPDVGEVTSTDTRRRAGMWPTRLAPFRFPQLRPEPPMPTVDHGFVDRRAGDVGRAAALERAGEYGGRGLVAAVSLTPSTPDGSIGQGYHAATKHGAQTGTEMAVQGGPSATDGSRVTVTEYARRQSERAARTKLYDGFLNA